MGKANKEGPDGGAGGTQGLVLPLVLSGSCTLREAVIMSSVLQRVSVPAMQSAAALARLADAPYSGITSFFIRVLLDKRYAEFL
jgi:essential nuclear protein 1